MDVEFLKTITDKHGISFQKGSCYTCINGADVQDANGETTDLKDKILVLQPDSTPKREKYCIIPKNQENKAIWIKPDVTQTKTGKTYTKDFYLTKKETEYYNNLLQMTGNHIYDRYGLKRDEKFEHTVIFTQDEHNVYMIIELIICSEEKPYIQAVLYEDGYEAACSEAMDELQDVYELKYKNNTYISRQFII